MSLWLAIAWAGTVAGLVGAIAQIARPARFELLPLCWGAIASVLLAGVGHGIGQLGALLDLTSGVGDPDVKARALTAAIRLEDTAHALVLTGVVVGILAVLAAVAWSRTRRAAGLRAKGATEPEA